MRNCELCKSVARMYCESDQASLCWNCDEKVHGANFLVAKHLRSLLCQICQSPTPWKASGSKFTPTVSICEDCAENHEKREERGGDEESHGGNEVENVFDDYDDESNEEEEEDDDEEEEEDAENQVVPWSCNDLVLPPPPPVESSSSSEGESTSMRLYSINGDRSSLKRNRHDLDLDSDDENNCCSSQTRSGPLRNEEASSVSISRQLKQRRTERDDDDDDDQEESKSTVVINSIKSLQESKITDEDDASAVIVEICKMSKDQSR